MKKYLLNTLLAIFTGVFLLVAMLVRTFSPVAILPTPGIPNLVFFSLVVLLTEHFLAPTVEHNRIAVIGLSLLSFTLLPCASGLVEGWQVIKLGIVGCVVFYIVTELFDAMTDRISTGHNTHMVAIVSALGIYLASQAFSGILL